MTAADAPVVSLSSDEALRAFVSPYLKTQEERDYFALHLRRYHRALEHLSWAQNQRAQQGVPLGEQRILDIAPHLLSEMMAACQPGRVNTVGVRFLEPAQSHSRLNDHLDLDLNQLHEESGWRSFHQHDVVFMGEIIEHLHAAPSMVLGCVRRWVKPGGYLIIQTPNAVALSRRLKLLFGHHPYDMIVSGKSALHIREYTGPELRDIGASLGLKLKRLHYENYFRNPDRQGLRRALFHVFTRIPRSLREGMTMVFQRPEGDENAPLESPWLTGNLEFAGLHDDGRFHAVGWVVNHRHRRPHDHVQLLCGEKLIGEGLVEVERSDVATSLGDAAYTRCGFHITLDAAPREGHPVEVRAVDEFGDHLILLAP